MSQFVTVSSFSGAALFASSNCYKITLRERHEIVTIFYCWILVGPYAQAELQPSSGSFNFFDKFRLGVLFEFLKPIFLFLRTRFCIFLQISLSETSDHQMPRFALSTKPSRPTATQARAAACLELSASECVHVIAD